MGNNDDASDDGSLDEEDEEGNENRSMSRLVFLLFLFLELLLIPFSYLLHSRYRTYWVRKNKASPGSFPPPSGNASDDE